MNASEQTVSGQPRRPGRPPVNFAARRNEIISAATKLFAERGFHGTSVANLCEAAGVGRGVLYHYIESKEEILFIIHERFIEPLLQRARPIAAGGDPPDVTLGNLSRELMSTIACYLDEVTVFLHEWKVLAGGDDRWKEVRGKRRELERIIQDTIEAGQERDIFRDLDPRMTALAFLGMHNYSYQWLRSTGRLSSEEIADLFSDLLLNGLRKRRRLNGNRRRGSAGGQEEQRVKGQAQRVDTGPGLPQADAKA